MHEKMHGKKHKNMSRDEFLAMMNKKGKGKKAAKGKAKKHMADKPTKDGY